MNINRRLVVVAKGLVKINEAAIMAEECQLRNRVEGESETVFRSKVKKEVVSVGSTETIKVDKLHFKDRAEYYAVRFCEFSQALDKLEKKFGECPLNALPEILRNIPDELLMPKIEVPVKSPEQIKAEQDALMGK